MATLSEQIVLKRNKNITDDNNCDLFYDDLKKFHKDRRGILAFRTEYAFARDLPRHPAPQIIRNLDKRVEIFQTFENCLRETFAELRRANLSHTKDRGAYQGYENILEQQWTCMFKPDVYIKPNDLRSGTNTQTRSSEFWKIFKQLTDPFLFEGYFIANKGYEAMRDFWERGDWRRLPDDESDSYYRMPGTSHLKALLLLFIKRNRDTPYIDRVYLFERNMARPTKKKEIMGATAFIPIVRIDWSTSSYSFEEY
jgi:hypothetical protein